MTDKKNGWKKARDARLAHCSCCGAWLVMAWPRFLREKTMTTEIKAALEEMDITLQSEAARAAPALLDALSVAVEALDDCTGGDLASGEGIYQAEIARVSLARIAAILGKRRVE